MFALEIWDLTNSQQLINRNTAWRNQRLKNKDCLKECLHSQTNEVS